ncbi:MAG TPA: hypothetical protein VGI06_00020 [Acidimicrobiales bacterium]
MLAERTAEAELVASKLVQDAGEEAARLRRDAAAEAEATTAQAVEQGRDMLAQAQAARERVLGDLARRRKVALAQLELLRAARERLGHSLEAARTEIETVMDDLSSSDEEARLAAEAIGRQTAKGNVAATAVAPPATPAPVETSSPEPPGEGDPGVEDRAAATAAQEGATGAGPVAPTDTDAGAPPQSKVEAPRSTEPAAPDGEAPAAVVAEGQSRAAGTEVSAGALVAAGEAEAVAPEQEEGSAEAEAANAEPGPGETEAAPAATDATPAEPPTAATDATPAETVPTADSAVAPKPAVATGTPTAGETATGPAPAGAAADTDAAVKPAGRQERTRTEPPTPRTPYRHDRVPAALLPDAAVGPPVPGAPGGKVDQLFARIRADRADRVSDARAVLAEKRPPPDAGEPVAAAEVPKPLRRRKPKVAAANGTKASDQPTPEAEPASGGDEDPALEAPRSDVDEAHLQRRDELIEPIVATAARALKRALADDQNAALDRLRTLRADKATADAVLGDEEDQLQAFARRATAGLVQAATAGARLALGGDAPAIDESVVAPLAARLAADVVGPFRVRLSALLDAGDGDRGPDTVDRLSGIYREWRSRVEGLAGDAVTEAVAAGLSAVVEAGTPVRWVVEDVDGPCPDCDDNALAGAIALGTAFPTGQLTPPAHPGCRCVLVQTAM